MSLRIFHRSAVAALALTFSSCTNNGGTGVVPAVASGGSHYQIAPGDLLTITLVGEPDYNQQVRVEWNGRINVPNLTTEGVGEVDAGGLSPSQLAERLSTFARANKVFVNPRVQVVVSEFVSQAFSVLGQVSQPGRLNFPKGVPPRLPIEEAIAMAGGYTRLAKQTDVTVRRGSEIFHVNLKKLASEPNHPEVIIVPGDVITVPERLF
jgi:polysaccharide export outer membrane protein